MKYFSFAGIIGRDDTHSIFILFWFLVFFWSLQSPVMFFTGRAQICMLAKVKLGVPVNLRRILTENITILGSSAKYFS